MRGDYVHHVGVGDLWVIAGQSNAAGTGTGPVLDPPELGIHQLGQDECWKLAAHPLEDATDTRHPVTVHGVFQAHSPWLAFARRLHAELGHPIGLIPTAMGGSALAAWMPGKPLANNFADLVRIAGGRVRGMVWHQGESDVMGDTVDAYPAAFRTAMAGLRAACGDPQLPCITGQLGRWTGAPDDAAQRRWTRQREQQRQLARELGHHVVPTVDLALGDEIHFTAHANVELGRRYAATVLNAVYGRSLPHPGIELRQATWRDTERRRLRLAFPRPPAGWVKVGPVQDFTVTDVDGAIAINEVHLGDDGQVDLTLSRAAGANAVVHAHFGSYPHPSLRDQDQRPITGFSVQLD
jgi:sialate O-acetylesterase